MFPPAYGTETVFGDGDAYTFSQQKIRERDEELTDTADFALWKSSEHVHSGVFTTPELRVARSQSTCLLELLLEARRVCIGHAA